MGYGCGGIYSWEWGTLRVQAFTLTPNPEPSTLSLNSKVLDLKFQGINPIRLLGACCLSASLRGRCPTPPEKV